LVSASPVLLPHENSEVSILARGLAKWARNARYRNPDGLPPKFIFNTPVWIAGEIGKAAPLQGRWGRYHLKKARSMTSELREFLLIAEPVDAARVFPATLRLYNLLSSLIAS